MFVDAEMLEVENKKSTKYVRMNGIQSGDILVVFFFVCTRQNLQKSL